MTNKSIRDYINLIESAQQGVAEVSEHNVGGISHSIIKHPGGKHQVVVKYGDKVAHTSLHNSEEDAKKSLASQVAHSKKMLKVDEQGVAEVSEHNVGGISHSIIKHPGGKHQVVVKYGDKVAHTSLHNSEEDAKKSLASQVAHSKKMLKVDEQGVAEGKK